LLSVAAKIQEQDKKSQKPLLLCKEKSIVTIKQQSFCASPVFQVREKQVWVPVSPHKAITGGKTLTLGLIDEKVRSRI